MTRKLVFLINPISGTKGKSLLKEQISERTRKEGFHFEIQHTSRDGNYDWLKEKIGKEKITDVVICGGDGTVSAVAASLLGVEVNIGIVPTGSGNGLALAAGISPLTSKALEVIFNGTASWIDGFFINQKFSCMLCGVGFDAKVAHAFAAAKRRGLQTYIRLSLLHFFSARPYPFTLEYGEKKFSADAFFISVANSNQFGNNLTIAPKASLKDGLLDIVVVKKMNKLSLPFSMIRQITGVNAMQELSDFSSKRNIIYFQCPSLTILNPGLAPLHIDGDPCETAAELEIRVVRKAMRLIMPRGKVTGDR
jgi:diacylglycerol kinase (ATP)